jgi:hypothetical protein
MTTARFSPPVEGVSRIESATVLLLGLRVQFARLQLSIAEDDVENSFSRRIEER